MSSILKALKKLENEMAEKDSSPFEWPQPVDTKGSFHSRVQNRFSLKFFSYKMALIFFLSTTLILLLFILYSENIQNIIGQEMAESYNSVAALNKIEKKTSSSKKIFVEKTEAGVNTFVSIEPKKKGLEESKKAAIQQVQSFKHDEAQKVEPRQVDFKETTLMPIKTAQAGLLTLQGISWSLEPIKRMAVVNSIIAREGKVIEGWKIARIEKKYVVIEKDGERLFLKFDKY